MMCNWKAFELTSLFVVNSGQFEPIQIASCRWKRCIWQGAHRRTKGYWLDLCLEVYIKGRGYVSIACPGIFMQYG